MLRRPPAAFGFQAGGGDRPVALADKDIFVRIELVDIVKQFGSLRVVDKVNLTIDDGEFFTLLGPSGCGKTTLLRMIAGFNDPDSGDILFGGKSVLSLPAHRRNTGMVFQNYALFPHMTVFDNVAYGMEARKLSRDTINKRVMEILDSVQLLELRGRYPRQLSGGQQQRVALARALVIRPDVLLMDEPLSNLDAKLRVTMREEIRHIQQNLGITTIYVTHDQEEAMAVSDRVAIFYNGSLQQVADPQGIYFAPANRFTAEFMGSCNILEMTPLSWNGERGLARMLCGGEEFEVAMHNSHGVCHGGLSEHAPEQPRLHEPVSMMLRPDWIHEVPPDSAERNVFTGHVHEVMFLGTVVVYQVSALGALLRVDVPALHCGDFKKVGDAITLCFSQASPVKVGA